MDSQEKLEILAACDFSSWRGWERAKQAGTNPADVHGFGNILFGMGSTSAILAEGHVYAGNADDLEVLLFGYQCLSEYYATVPFDRMDPTDEDFRFLFDYKAKLDELGGKVEVFAERVRANGMTGSKDWPEYVGLKDLISELMHTDYRETVLEKHDMVFSAPSSSQ